MLRPLIYVGTLAIICSTTRALSTLSNSGSLRYWLLQSLNLFLQPHHLQTQR